MAMKISDRIKEFAGRQISRLRDEARRNVREMMEAEAPSTTLAMAFATGTLISTIPVPLVDMALAAAVTKKYSDMPRAPFLTGMALANNLVMAPLYASTPRVGSLALHWLAGSTSLVAPDVFLLKILVGYLLIALGLGLGLGSFILASTGFFGYKTARKYQMTNAS